MAGGTALGLLTAFAYVKLATPIYRSSTTLQFQEKGSTVPVLDALRDLQGGTEVGTEMEVLRSRSLAEAVIDSLGLQVGVAGPRGVRRGDVIASVQADADAPEGRVRLVRGEDGRFAAELVEGEDAGDLGSAAPGEPLRLPGATVVLAPAAAELDRIELAILPRTLAAERFGEALGVSRPNRDANMVQARFDALDPELARDVANVLAHQYLVRRNAVRKVSDRSTVDFLRSQVDTLQGQLRSAEEAVRRFREQNRVVNLEAEAQAQVERLAALQGQRAELEAEREALAGLLADARAADGAGQGASPYRRLLAFPTLLRNQTTSTLLQALTVRETELSQLGARRTPADPDYQAVAGQLRELEDQATAVVTTYLGGLANQVEAIDRELAGFGQRMAAVPAKEVEYARLERSARVLADIYTLLQTRLKEAEVLEAVEDASVRVVDPAELPRRPVRTAALFLLALGGSMGALTGFAAAMLRRRLDSRIRSRDRLEHRFAFPILASVPRLVPVPNGGGGVIPKLIARGMGSGASSVGLPAEAFRSLRTSLAFIESTDRIRTLLLSSPAPGDGKSTIAVHLAASLAAQGRRVLIVDGDMRRAGLSRSLGVDLEPGLSEVLADLADERPVRRLVSLPGAASFDLIPAGLIPPDPAALVSPPRLASMLERIGAEYDQIILDAPPVTFDETLLAASQVDGTALVVRADATEEVDLASALRRLDLVHARVIGLIANDVTREWDPTFWRAADVYAAYRVDRG